mgnify:CR=1 FL=1
MKFILILYYCLTTCQTVVYPEYYWSAKECAAIANDITATYRILEKIDPKVKIGNACIEYDLGMMRIPL